ncbi:MAG: hypothetical protein HKN82_04100 [Akkermansiaceae bacterium]|nr:hypothetical protein [Akkermansiaceae bacterium]
MPDLPLSDFLPAVEEQIASPQTPFVKAAYDRLVQDPDIDPEEARQMIALCLADEVEAMNSQDRPFDTARYQTLLDLLPALPE